MTNNLTANIAQVVEDLRRADRWDAHYYGKEFESSSHNQTPYEAADTLLALAAENDALKAEVERLKAEADPEMLTIAWMDGAHDAKRLARENATLRAQLAEAVGALERDEETLDQILDDMRGDGQCVCLAVKNEAIKTLAANRATIAKLKGSIDD